MQDSGPVRDCTSVQDSTRTQWLSDAEVARWTHVGMLSAVALLLSYAETFVPIPIPGVRLGLANNPVLVALSLHDATGAAFVALIKVLASGFLFGSPLTMAYSLVGTALSLAGMIPLSHLRTMRLWMLSIVGALLHEVGQLVLARAILGTDVVWYMLPVLLVAGTITGLVCGLLAQQLASAIPREDQTVASLNVTPQNRANSIPTGPTAPSCTVTLAFLGLLAYILVVFHLSSPIPLAACVVLALVACMLVHVRPRSLLRLLSPLVAIGALTYVLHLLVSPSNALLQTGVAMARLASVALASMASMRILPQDDLTATMAWLLLPLTCRGVRTQGFLLAFDVALRLVPSISQIVREEFAALDGPLTPTKASALLSHTIERLYASRD